MHNVYKLNKLIGIVVFGLFILLTSSVFSQDKPDRTAIIARLYQHYWDRIKSFEAENQTFKKVVLLGDSITEGFKIEQYFPGRPFINRGIVADGIGVNTTGILHRLDNSVFDCNPSHVFILIGINDLAAGRSQDTILRVYREVLTRIQSRLPKVKVYIISVLPCRGKYAHLNQMVLDFNAKLKSLADEFQYHYLDLHALLKDENGELREEFTADGLHLKPPAYEIWKQEIDRLLTNLNPQTTDTVVPSKP
ncbi:MAG: GDSL-type esterase/lipase family protein [bacterium]|nr:GDSL-type esterase/lipase family protein [bacterium]